MKSPLLLLFILISCFINSLQINAQTSGPSQPEVQSFQAASITNMVETSTGQFQYNVPLFTIGNYPINVNYNSRITMDQEASMVGLGFNLNCGAITRQVRGIFDDADGDSFVKRVNMKENVTKGINLGFAVELIGLDKIGLGLNYSTGIFYNNYTGFGIESAVGAGFHANGGGCNGNAGIGITSNSQHGTGVNPYFGLSYQFSKNEATEKGDSWKKSTDKTVGKSIKDKISIGGSIGYNFNSTSYNPKIDFPFKTRAIDFSVNVGLAGFYVALAANVKGYIMKQSLETNKIENPAFGFLYAEKGKDISNALMDFNREHDGMMTETKPNLPLAYGTPDVYSVTGQGIGGIFELKRNNIFLGFDPAMSTNNLSGGLEIDMGFGSGTHLGAEIRLGYIVNTSKKWNNPNNGILSKLDFPSVVNSSGSNGATAEQVYFKNPNDVMFNFNPIFNLTKFQPIAPRIKTVPFFGGSIKADYMKLGNTNLNVSTSIFSNYNRDNRTDVIYYLTAKEASDYAIEKKIASYYKNDFRTAPEIINRVGDGRADNHFSEMICLKTDGTRYVFDKPAYNMEKRDVSFSINESTDVQNYLVDADLDITTPSNKFKGIDEFISITETPSYAHSFLLGSVLSPNYIDVDDNGPTTNDIGDYVKFNYTRLYKDYYWRSNNEFKKAAVELGNIADPKDGKGFYSEGKKEIWNIHSIESKNEISRFYYSDRIDAFEIDGGGRKLQRLDSILVFSRPEIESNPSPVPFKRVYFAFNGVTPLCKGVLNTANTGKLTLEKIYFKDGTSNKGKYSAYQFTYDNNANPNYNTNATDRWGNYKPDVSNQSGLNLDNKYFQFTNQDNSAKADKEAASWLLKSIILPSGGKISLDYEAHDYAFVQDKRAMYMTPVIAVTPSRPSNFQNLNGSILYSGSQSNNYLVFKLKKPIAGTISNNTANFYVKKDYLTDNLDSKYGTIVKNHSSGSNSSNLYGKFRVSLSPNDGYGDEDIPVFLDVDSCGALKIGTSGNYDYGYVVLSSTFTKEFYIKNANQISKTAWQFTKNSYPRILLGMDADPSLSSEERGDALANLFLPIGNIVKTIMQTSPNDVLQKKNVAQNFTPNQSYIRLYEPTFCKIGGNGARVKQITIDDNWNAMSGGIGASYTIKYDYKKIIGNDTISSGVASYEPEIGGEENPWKQPIFYEDKNTLMPDDNKFLMTPFGESLFPSADINYSEVKTTQNPVSNATTQQGTGYTLNKYYTFYDFPCKVDQGQIELERKPKLTFSILKNFSHDYMLATQGYVVTTNDMHGKPKAEEVYDEKGTKITAKYYTYKTDNQGNLDNFVKSVDSSGIIKNQNLLGVETQTYGDVRSFETQSFSGSYHGNIDFQMLAILPTFVPSLWPDLAYEKKQFASFEITKHIRQQGILESVTAFDKGSTIKTTNELWDVKTGAVLLTSANNEFKDPIYSFTYPAHWAYSGMGMASENISATFNGITPPINRLQVGDILGVNGNKFVVNNTSPFSASKLYSPYMNFSASLNNRMKIISSGKKNLATTSIGSFSSLVIPINANNKLIMVTQTKVIDATAIEFTNKALQSCDSCTVQKEVPVSYKPTIYNSNHYYLNSLTNLTPWQPEASYKNVIDRTQTNNAPDLRKDGHLSFIAPFWIFNSSSGHFTKLVTPNWQFTEKVNIIDSRLNPVQTVNPLNIYSTANQSNFDGFVNSTTANARFHETLSDGFEDVRNGCEANHYAILNDKAMLDDKNAHTGYYSMKTNRFGYTKRFILDNRLNIGYKIDSSFISPDCEPKLTLLSNKKYILSAWVKPLNANNISLDYTNASVGITLGTNLIGTANPKGQIIDGWQRIDFEFKTTPQLDNLSLSFAPNCNFDDIRIYPADALMKSYVYSYKDYSLMATLDENNFATFYEYDQQKQLKRVKKETQKGISTIQEVNFGSFKK